MEKEGIVNKLLPADILLVSEKGLKHSINRTFGRSRWHHVMLCIGKGKVLEATPRKGCHISKLDLTKDCYIAYKALRHRKLSDAEKKKIAETAVKIFLGKKFNWQHLLKVFFRRQLSIVGNNGKARKPGYRCNVNSIICSNLVAMNYHMAGCSISDRWAPEYVMPRDYDKSKEFAIVFEKIIKREVIKNNEK